MVFGIIHCLSRGDFVRRTALAIIEGFPILHIPMYFPFSPEIGDPSATPPNMEGFLSYVVLLSCSKIRSLTTFVVFYRKFYFLL